MSTPRYTDLLQPIREYVIRQWLAGQPTTIVDAARHLGELRSTDRGGAPSTPVLTAFDHLEAKGIVVRDQATSTRKLRVLRCWNWSGIPVEDQSLATLLDPFLSAPRASDPVKGECAESHASPARPGTSLAPVDEQRRHTVLSAVAALLRHRFGADAVRRGPERHRDMLDAARRVPIADLSLLPDEVKRAVGGASGEKYHAALQWLLAYGARHDLVAMVVTAPSFAHPWAPWAAAHAVPASQRIWLYRVADADRAVRGAAAAATPDELSVDAANGALAALATRRELGAAGKRAAREARAVLVSLGTAGHGPYRELACQAVVRRSGERTFAPQFMLTSDDEESRSWDGTRRILAREGLHAFDAFYRWFEDFSTLSLDALRERYGSNFVRRGKREVKAATARQRHAALRVWLGVARTELGLSPEDCRPEVVFGRRFTDTLVALRKAWAHRVAAQERLAAMGLPTPGHHVTVDSPTLERHIINAGLIADGLADWGEHLRSVDERTAPSVEMIAVWRAAYRTANADVDNRGLTLRGRRRTQKRLAEVLNDVTSLALVDASNRRALDAIQKAPAALSTAILVQKAILGALVATGQLRIGEVAALQYRTHFRIIEGQAAGRSLVRLLALSADERKGATVAHEAALPDAIIPFALWDWHREHGRGLLMRPWVATGRDAHDYIFCAPLSGAPFGWPHEERGASQLTDRERAARMAANAASTLSSHYANWRRDALHRDPRFKIIVGGRGHHSAHAARNHVTRLLTDLQLGDRLCFLLGHTPRERSEALYGQSVGQVNAETLSRVMQAAPWNNAAASDVDAPRTLSALQRQRQALAAEREENARLGERLRPLLQRLDDLSPRELHAAVAGLVAPKGAAT